MITITMDNVQSKIKVPTKVIFNELKELLSYRVEGAEFAMMHNPHWDGRKNFLKKNGTFPSGLVPIVEKYAKDNEMEIRFIDNRGAVPTERLFTSYFPSFFEDRPYQSMSVDISAKNPRGVFVCGTGAGKTYMAARIMDRTGVETLFVTPNTDLREQVYSDFCEWFGKERVGKKPKDNKPIIVANIQSLAKCKEGDLERFKQLVIDEFHHAGAKTYQKLNELCSQAYYRYGFTGTFLRTDGTDMDMHSVLYNVLMVKTTSELIEDGYLVRPHVEMIRLRTKPKLGKNCSYKDAYEHIVSDYEFHQLSAIIANKNIDEGRQTIILVRRIEHGEALQELIPRATFVHGRSKERKQIKQDFLDKKIPAVIATNIFGEGTDIPCIETIVNCRCEKTEIDTRQGAGRGLRRAEGKTDVRIYDFLIMGQKHLEQHSAVRARTYKSETAFKVTFQKSEHYIGGIYE